MLPWRVACRPRRRPACGTGFQGLQGTQARSGNMNILNIINTTCVCYIGMPMETIWSYSVLSILRALCPRKATQVNKTMRQRGLPTATDMLQTTPPSRSWQQSGLRLLRNIPNELWFLFVAATVPTIITLPIANIITLLKPRYKLYHVHMSSHL